MHELKTDSANSIMNRESQLMTDEFMGTFYGNHRKIICEIIDHRQA